MARRTARGRRSVARGFIAQLPALLRSIVVFGAVLACGSVAWAQSADGARPVPIRTITGRRPSGPDRTPDGARVFQTSCATCHTGAAESRAPSLDALRTRTLKPSSTVSDGSDAPARLAPERSQRRAVAEFITGKTLGDVSGALTGRCTSSWPLQDLRNAAMGWLESIDYDTRFQPADQAGLNIADLRRLKLKWAFGFPDASVAWSHPTVAAGRLFIGSQNGTVLARREERVHWTFSAAGACTALAVARAGGSRLVVYFADTAANAYALDADTGRQLWVRRVDDHPSARITGSPTFFEGRLYVPLSSYEEAQGADPQYPCCTFRGSVAALDAESGVEWKTYMIAESPQRRDERRGSSIVGPSGAGIWSAPTVDASRRLLYVATGNAYSAPATSSSDAVVALDLATGAIRWTRQVTANDVYVSNCRAGNLVRSQSVPTMTSEVPRACAPPGRDRDWTKSGVAFAMDPEKSGEILWQYRAGQGSALGGIEWGAATDGEHAYFAVSDILTKQPGGLHAVNLETGTRVGHASTDAKLRLEAGVQRRAVRRCDCDCGRRVFGIQRRLVASLFDLNRRDLVGIRQ